MFSYRLQEAMDLRGVTQQALSLRTGVSQSHISRILRGEREPAVDIAVRLAYALDVSLDWLCGLPARDDQPLGVDEDELLAIYRALDPTFKSVALAALRVFPKDS